MTEHAYLTDDIGPSNISAYEDARSKIYVALQKRFHCGQVTELLNTYEAFEVYNRSVVIFEQTSNAILLACYEHGVLQYSFDHALDTASINMAVKEALFFLSALFAMQAEHGGILSLYSERDWDEPNQLIDIVTFHDGSIGTRRCDQATFHIRRA